jgi:hypothetical protein
MASSSLSAWKEMEHKAAVVAGRKAELHKLVLDTFR